MTRPCWYIGLALLVGCLIGAWLPINVLSVTAIGFCSIGIVVMAVPFLRYRRTLLLLLVGVCAAFVSLSFVQLHGYLPLSYRVGQTVTLTAQVNEQDGISYLTVTDGELSKGTRLQLWNYDSVRSPKPYDTVTGKFVLCDHGEKGLSLLQRKASGIWFAVKPETMTVSEGEEPWYACFRKLREQAVTKIESYLSGDVAALISGICFGADQKLSEEAKGNFRVGGTYHLFSVSGFHMALLSQAILRLLRRLRVPRVWRALISIAALFFFMALVGNEAPVTRSGLLCVMILLGDCFRRQADTCNTLGLALIVLLIASPMAAYDAGLLLSFFATFGLVLVSPHIIRVIGGWVGEPARKRVPVLAKLYDSLASIVTLTLSATMATLPISLIYFGEISLVAVLGNLLTSAAASALLVFGLLASLCIGPLLQPLATVLFFVTGQCSQYLLWISEKISKIPFVTVAITTPYLLLWVVGITILAVIGHLFFRRKGLIAVAVTGAITLTVSLVAHTVLMRGVATVTLLPTQNDVAFCVQYEGETVLVCAPVHTGSVRKMQTALQLSGIRQVDALVVPFGNQTALMSMLSQWGSVLDNARLWYADETEWLCPYFENALPFPETPTAVIDGVLCNRYGEQLHLQIRQTDIVCFFTDETVRSLPPALRQSEVVVFGQSVPSDALLLQAAVGFVQATSDTSPLPFSYGANRLLTVGRERMCFTTRGVGDITY